MNSRRRKLLLHAGLPKTGSSALQQWCFVNREKLQTHGFRYLDVFEEEIVPKHQYAVAELRAGDFPLTARQLALAGEESLILSSEGFMNQFSFFDPAHLASFRHLLSPFDVSLVIVRREKEPWLRSYYKQCVVNPATGSALNATSLPFDEFRLLDRPHFIHSLAESPDIMAEAFGAVETHALRYEDDWFGHWKAILGLNAGEYPDLPYSNISIPDQGVEFIRYLNRAAASPAVRNGIMKAIQHVWPQNHNVLNFYRTCPDLSLADVSAARDCLAHLPDGDSFAADLKVRIGNWLDDFEASAGTP
jgi:hypothetical protein